MKVFNYMNSLFLRFSVCGSMIATSFMMGTQTPAKMSSTAGASASSMIYSTPGTAMQGLSLTSPFSAPCSPISKFSSPGSSASSMVSPIGSSGLFSPGSTSFAGAGNLSTSLDSSSGMMNSSMSSLSSISVNQSLVDDVTARTRKPKKIASEDVRAIKRNFQQMQDTPGQSKKLCMQGVCDDVARSLWDSPTVDSRRQLRRPPLGSGYAQAVVDNDRALTVYRAVPGNQSKKRRMDVLAAGAELGGTPEMRSRTVVDTQHCMVPEFNIHKKTGKIIQVSGGHDEHSYDQAVLDPVYFESKDGRKGLSIAGVDVKTVEPKFDHTKILDVVKCSTVVATNASGSFKVLQAPDGTYYGCHPDLSNPLIMNSVFPIITLPHDSHGSPSKPVSIGNLKKVSPGRSTVQLDRPVFASLAEFNSMISEGQRLQQDPKATVQIIDVSVPLAARYVAELQDTGLIKYPPMFAVVSNS